MKRKFTIYNLQFTNGAQRGQVIVILLLLMLVALSIGLAVTQRSVTDVTTSTQTEQSSRAFSAAEAGLEKALSGSLDEGSFSLDNSSSSNIQASAWLPQDSGTGIEYPPIGRETTAQFWFTDPTDQGIFYTGDSAWLYFGNPNAGIENDSPAIEVEVVMLASGKFYSQTYFYDSDSSRVAANGFKPVSCNGNALLNKGILGNNHLFYCKVQIPRPYFNVFPNPAPGGGNCDASRSCQLILARVRLLYSSQNHKIALEPLANTQLPRQVQIYNSTGIAGQSQKQIQAFRVKDVVPPWFNFAVFSINEIKKGL